MMDERPWEKQLKSFLKRASEDLQKAGEELRTEAEKVYQQLKDPEKQQKLKDSVQEFGSWAKQTAMEAAGKLDTMVTRVEDTFRTTAERARSIAQQPAAPARPAPKSKKRPAKTVGRKKAKTRT